MTDRMWGRGLVVGARAVLAVGLLAGLGMLGWGLTPAPAAPLPAQTFDVRSDVAGPVAQRGDGPDEPVLAPVTLAIPSLGVEAPLRPERVSDRGALVVPGDPQVLGTWHAGRTGEDEAMPTQGTVVVAGHVDVDGDLGALHDLSTIDPGGTVVLTDAEGGTERWRVDALEVRHKDDLPEFDATGERRLAVVTCGGPVETTPSGGRTYRDNVIAWASPAS